VSVYKDGMRPELPPPPNPSLTLDELCTLVELPTRTVRYYIQLGLVDRPDGETRAARYGRRHVDQLLQIRKWTGAGLSLERVRELLHGAEPVVPPRPRGPGTVEVWSHLVVADGLELTVEPSRAGLSPEQLRVFLDAIADAYQRVRQAPCDPSNPPLPMRQAPPKENES
jgi:DNA-binding transcriptional MerR regulator